MTDERFTLVGPRQTEEPPTPRRRPRRLRCWPSAAVLAVIAAGCLGCLTAAHVRAGQTVLDVSTNWDAVRGCMAGDADFDAVASLVDAITPVPNGVGAVTSSVLMHHVLTAAERAAEGGGQ